MTLSELKDSIEEYVLLSMREYLEENEEDEDFDEDEEETGTGDVPYTERDVNLCGAILERFIDELEECGHDEKAILKCAKSAVLKLNKLNERLDYELIEIDQRDALCEFFFDAVNAAGLETEEDVTEEWRDW